MHDLIGRPCHDVAALRTRAHARADWQGVNAGMQHVSVDQVLPLGGSTAPDGTSGAQQCGLSTQLKLDLPASDTLLLAQPILQSREQKAIVVLTDRGASTTSVHLLSLQRGCRLDLGNRQAHWVVTVDSAAFDGRTRCLALLSLSSGTVLICTMDAAFVQLKTDASLPLMSWLPQLSSIRLVPGRKVRSSLLLGCSPGRCCREVHNDVCLVCWRISDAPMATAFALLDVHPCSG